MLRNYFLLALRRLRSEKGYTAITISGLAIAMATCVLIGLYIHHEWSVDRFHDNRERIVMVGTDAPGTGRQLASPAGLVDVLNSQVPSVETATRTDPPRISILRAAETSAEGQFSVLGVGEAFFDIFTFPEIEGSASEALQRPDGIVLTETTARRLFGAESAMGQPVELQRDSETQSFTVGAVVRDVVEASTIRFEAVIPSSTGGALGGESDSGAMPVRMMLGGNTYALLHDASTEAATVVEQIKQTAASQLLPTFEPFVVPFTSLYLSDFHEADGFRGEMRYLYIFGSIALFILLIAAINYVNLATAQGARRAREVGIRKVMGAVRPQLIRQFLLESVVVSLIALLLALGLVSLLLPAFNNVFGTGLALELGSQTVALTGLALFVVGTGVLAGAYPAFVLTHFEPASVLRKQGGTSLGGGSWLRRTLVVTQFAISTALIIGTVVVYQQLNFMQTKNLGFEGEQVVVMDLPDGAWSQREALKAEASSHGDILRVSAAQGAPGRSHMSFTMEDPSVLSPRFQGDEGTERVTTKRAYVDHDYVESLGLKLVAGRNFDRNLPGDENNAVLINETLADLMGWTAEEAVGMPLMRLGGGEMEVIGVVEDYHTVPLHSAMTPVIIEFGEFQSPALMPGVTLHQPSQLIARINPEGARQAIDHLERAFTAVLPDAQFNYEFLSDTFSAAYEAEVRLSRIFSAFTFVALFIAGMGLFGLSAHTAQKRTREIGIRKALGATVPSIVGLLSKEFTWLIGVAILIGVPASYVAMHYWLQEFPFRTEIGLLTVLTAVTGALLIAAISVSYHAIRAALTDPAKSLHQ